MMNRNLYIKFNTTREEKFRLITSIGEEDSGLFSYKKALNPKSVPFLNSLIDKYNYLVKQNLPFSIVKPEKIGESIRFEFINAKSLDAMLFGAILERDAKEIKNIFINYCKIIEGLPRIKAELAPEFKKIFGDAANGRKFDCVKAGCLDFILENILIDNGKNYLIDYEWTFTFPIPASFIVFRSIINSYHKYAPYAIDEAVPLGGLLSDIGISESDVDTFIRLEHKFQEYISGHEINFAQYFNSFKAAGKKSLTDGLSQLQEQKREIEARVHEKNQEIEALRRESSRREQELAAMNNSRAWKLASKLVTANRLQKGALRTLKNEGVKSVLAKTARLLKRRAAQGRSRSYFKFNFKKWIRENEKVNISRIKTEIKGFSYTPKFSVIIPVFNVEPKLLDKCIRSVMMQYYENWELSLQDDNSSNKETIRCLQKWESIGDKRIKISYGKKSQHISLTSNDAIKRATGEFIILIDNDDEITPNALYEAAKVLNEHPETDMIYSDEDKLTAKGRRIVPFFKPDWSPDLFFSMMYTCHLGFYRKAIVNKIGGFRNEYVGAQDYDLALRFIEHTTPNKIFHISKILYHWRMIETSTALSPDAKNYAYEAGKRALIDYIKRNEIKGEVLDGPYPGHFRVKRSILGNPKVSIIIPFRDQKDILRRCVSSIRDKSSYGNYEIILIDNESKEPETLEYVKGLLLDSRIKLLTYGKPFNFSAMNNMAATYAEGDFLLFLNNDTEVINHDWIESMLEHAQRKEIGAVGAKLFFPNNTVQHAGIVLRKGDLASHIYKFLPSENFGYMGLVRNIRNVSAVTAACLMVRKDLFLEAEGFDEKNFSVAYNDVDFCLRLLEKGYYNLITPYAELYHHESFSRGSEEDISELDAEDSSRVLSERSYMRKKWSKYIESDPFYSPNLTQGHDNPVYWDSISNM